MSDLSVLIDRLAGAKLLVVGDVMLDRFVHGAVDRISPEAPIPVLRVEREATMLGGAGNVAANLAAVGASVTLLSVVGDDDAGRALTALVGEKLAGAEGLLTETGRRTTVKTRFVAGGQQLLRADRETFTPIRPKQADRLVVLATQAIADADVMILSDYGKGVLTVPVAERLIAAANAAERTVVVDPKGRDYTKYFGATCITPNRRELEEVTGLSTGNDVEVELAATALMRATGVPSLVVTRSEQGLTVVSTREDGSPAFAHLPTEAREVFDVSGAGDTVAAVLAASLAVGADLLSAARLANTAAGIVVAKSGTASARPEEMRGALHRHNWERAEAKVAGIDAAIQKVAQWRRQGVSIGFTNGCFDLLHPGHVSLLGQAKAACDKLVVGLNSDGSVRRLKGSARPVQNETARSTVLASLADVDMVVVFDEDTPIELIRALRPDVLVKGADYTLDKVVGADLVTGWGGRVLLATLMEGHSTTGTISRMKAGDA